MMFFTPRMVAEFKRSIRRDLPLSFGRDCAARLRMKPERFYRLRAEWRLLQEEAKYEAGQKRYAQAARRPVDEE